MTRDHSQRTPVTSEIKKNKKTPMFDIIYHMVTTHESVPFTEIKISDEEKVD